MNWRIDLKSSKMRYPKAWTSVLIVGSVFLLLGSFSTTGAESPNKPEKRTESLISEPTKAFFPLPENPKGLSLSYYFLSLDLVLTEVSSHQIRQITLLKKPNWNIIYSFSKPFLFRKPCYSLNTFSKFVNVGLSKSDIPFPFH
jgi:hypothetical protein